MSYLANFNHQIYGPKEGRKWVFLHGLMGFLNNWRKIINYLEATECCLAFDQRGHGRSMKPESGYSPEEYADDLKKILDELGWNKIILVGHSMGGRNALSFAVHYPDYIEKLIIEDIAPIGPPEGWRYYENLLGIVPAPFPSRTEAREFFQNEFKQKVISHESADVLAAYFYANMEDKGDGTVSWRFLPEAILESALQGAHDRWKDVERLQVPTLWIRGENSKELRPSDYQKILKTNHLIQGVEIPGAGHWVHSEQPLAFVESLKSFVGGIS